ncbi:hypothetical protein U8335_03915 [Roseiconus lacunae]|uniref:hypothetical protein n=1 Tax=Roseiconus lacunae TaxID=2605694 RepID=UPI0030932A2B|nr:hypothetical protein U8335_03915 [Stieleria sp. HD01]
MDSVLKDVIDDVHQHVVETSHKIVRVLVAEQYLDTKAAGEFLLFSNQLFRLTPASAHPLWLTQTLDFSTENFIGGLKSAEVADFALFLLSNIHKIESPILSTDELRYDFDHAFDEAREAVDLSSTFEKLIERLEEIIAADVIDSRVVQQTLERLKALLKRNKHGSLTSILVSLHYGRFAIKAFEGVLSANKHLKPVVTAFKEEFSIAEEKVRDAEARLKKAAVERLTNEDRLRRFFVENRLDSSTVQGYLTLRDDDQEVI